MAGVGLSAVMKLCAVTFLSLLMAACAIVKPVKPEEYAAQIGIVNHTGRYIYATSIGDSGGGHASAYHAGVANVCCVKLPDVWRPGLNFLVQWDMPVNGEDFYRKAVVDVEEYSEPGSMYIHFFPDDTVRLVVTKWYGGSDKHPIPRPQEPGFRGENPEKW